MSQRDYGAVSPENSSSSTLRSQSRGVSSATVSADGHASVSSSVTNLANTVIGAGALAFPSAFASMGMINGVLSCLFSACTMIFGLYLLSRCAAEVGKRPGDEGRKASFNEVARLTFGKGWATRLFDLAVAIKCFGVSVSYLIICKTLLPQVCYTLSKALHHPLPEDSIMLQSHFWLFMVMIVIIPLSFLRTLDALRFTSQIALLTVVYLVLVVVGWFILKGVSPTRGEVVLFRFGKSTAATFPVQVFAFTCAQNLFPIYNELENKTQRRMNTVIISSIGSAAAVYEVLGVIGYLTFGSKVGSNIIAMYPATSLFIAIGRLGIVLLVGLSYPLQLLPCRGSVHHLTHGIFKRRHHASPVAGAEADAEQSDDDDDDEDDPLVPKNNGRVDDHGVPIRHEMARTEFITITLGILLSGFLIAYNVHELEVVLGFVGSTGSTIISFILPGFFYFRLFRQESGRTKWFALALAIYGTFVMIFCLTFNILHLSTRKG